MGNLLLLLMHVGKFVLATGLLTLLYLWLFRGKASYNLCRLYLLSIPLLAVLVSQFSVRWNVSLPDYIQASSIVPLRSAPEAGHLTIQESAVSNTILGANDSAKVMTYVDQFIGGNFVLIVVYVVVTLCLLLAFFKQVGKVLRIRREGLRKSIDTMEVVVHPHVPTPFSFYKTIFLNESLNESKMDLVLKHEHYHIAHKHYIDVLLVQVLVRLAWFNPVHWWIRKELVSLNEFQADQSVLNEGFDMYHYQTVILEEVMATNPFLASGLNDSFTKRRFVMMKHQPTQQLKALRRMLLLPALVALFVVFSLDIHGTTDFQKMTPVARNLSYLNKVDSEWDEQSDVCALSSTFEQALANKDSKATYSMVYFSYRLNEDTLVNKQVVEDDLEALSEIIESVVKEGEALDASKGTNAGSGKQAGSYTSLSALIDFLHYNIDDRNVETVTCQKSKALALDMDETTLKDALTELGALGLLARKAANSPLGVNDKLLKYKYLAFKVTANPLVWKSLEPYLVKLALEGQTTQQNIVFLRLGRGRLRNQLNDARIWSQAPRFGPTQVSVCREEVWFDNNGISCIRRTREATRVTMHYKVGGNESWFYFDKGLSLIDRATGDIYLIKKIDRNIPLNQTIVVTGCCNRYVEFTLVFPPLPEAVTVVDLREFVADRSNIMSDGGGDMRLDKLVLKEYALK